MARRKQPTISDALLDQLLAGTDPGSAFEPNGLLDGLKKALAERALNAEMDSHLAASETKNTRNGYSRKRVATSTGALELSVRRFHRAWGCGNRRFPQDSQGLRGIKTADTMRLEHLRYGTLADFGRMGRCWRQTPEVEKPVGRDISAQLEGLRVIAPELVADAVGQSRLLMFQFVSHSRPFPQLDNGRVGRLQPA